MTEKPSQSDELRLAPRDLQYDSNETKWANERHKSVKQSPALDKTL